MTLDPSKLYDTHSKAGNPENLITQPYDKIDPEMQKEYYEKSPYNYCRLILPFEENKYEVANATHRAMAKRRHNGKRNSSQQFLFLAKNSA